MVLSGRMSKTVATEVCMAKYADISDAMEALIRNQFIKFSGTWRKPESRKHRRLYKVTEKGLKHLLETKLTPEVFWKAITLLCFSSKKPITQNKFEGYYNQFERDYLGHFSLPGYFFLTHLFEDILEQWFQTHDVYSLSLTQIVIESLALHGPLTMDKLIEKTGAKQDDINKAIDNYSIYENFSLNSFLPLEDKKQTDRKNIYHNFITHLHIIMKKNNNKEKFELSLFGVLLAIALIRRYYLSKADSDTRNPSLFYQHIDEKEYIDSIIQNHKDKIPLIFGKWEFLKAYLGKIMLYEEFDSLIDNTIKSYKFNRSIWLRGIKEFYDDIHALTRNAANKLIPIYNMGKHLLERYDQIQPGIVRNPRMTPVYQKISDLRNILDNAMFSISINDLGELRELRDIRKIEVAFGDEVSLLFYLGLNMMDMPGSKQDLIERRKTEQNRLILPPKTEEYFRLGGPKNRLMSILTKDNDIKEWFSAWIESLIRYREHTLDEMSKFYNEVIEAHKHLYSPPPPVGVVLVQHDEYDMTKICSDIESVYDY
jgi:hypothetical protein